MQESFRDGVTMQVCLEEKQCSSLTDPQIRSDEFSLVTDTLQTKGNTEHSG